MVDKKKIAIVTWYYSKNFGTVLQAFSLLRYLASKGYDVCIVDQFALKGGFKPIIKNTIGYLGLLTFAKSILHKKDRRLQNFFHSEIKLRYVFNKSQLRALLKETNVFLSGSDQIWNPYYEKFSTFFMLDFAKGKKKIAYATSVGTDNFDTKEKELIRELLQDYRHIGVREDSVVDFLNKFTGRKDVRQVLDPTFLLNSEDWGKITSIADYGIDRLPSKYMLCYLVGNNFIYKEQAINVAKAYGITNIIIVPSIENPNFIIDGSLVLKDMGPREFVGLISNADVVCTDSFHATALSINMSKDFVEFKRFSDNSISSQNSRIYSILSHYGLMNKLYDDKRMEWFGKYDTACVCKILEEDRHSSCEFLLNSIEN